MTEMSRQPHPDQATVRTDGYTVAGLCRAVEATVDAAFPDEVWVRGTIAGLNRSQSGHVYFDLVDDADVGRAPEAVLPVALFNTARHRVNAILRKTRAARIENGTEVRIRGRVLYYSPQGRVQLKMSLIDPAYTLGRVEAARLELLERLGSEGLLEANRSLPYPVAPLRVALIASTGSAAEADFLRHLDGSGWAFHVVRFDARVQGADAVGDLVAALAGACDHPCVDVVAIVRGGGARTDLAAFDHERLARAIASATRPVLVGIGHETDRTVADEVAALPARTPTGCAQVLIDRVAEFDARLVSAMSRVTGLATRRLTEAKADLARSHQQLERVGHRLDREEHALQLLGSRLASGARRRLLTHGHRLDTAATKVDLLDPRHALHRGWAIVRHAPVASEQDTSSSEDAGRLIRSKDDVQSNDRLVITVADGEIPVRVGHGDDPEQTGQNDRTALP